MWLDLKRATTGLGFNVQKGVTTASDEWWDEKIQENNKYSKFKDAPMENLDELEVMFQHINVTGASSVILGGPSNAATIDLGDDSQEDTTALCLEDGKKKGKRKRSAAVPRTPKKKARNPMVRQVTKLIDVIANGRSKNDQKINEDIIQLMEDVVKAGDNEGSDEHFMATKLFVKQEYRAVFCSFKTNDGKMAWLKRIYKERKRT